MTLPNDYLQAAERAMKKEFALDMPMMTAIPDTTNETNMEDAVEYQDYLSQYRREVADMLADEFGIVNKRHGRVPAIVTNLGGTALGRTVFNDYSEASAIAFEEKLSKYPSLLKKRVALHEAGHVQAEEFVGYCMDLSDDEKRDVLESIPEYGMRIVFEKKSKDKNDKWGKLARLMKTSTPYRTSVELGEKADKHYVSKDGKRGYRAFLEDIREHKSGRYAMKRLNECIKNPGVYEKIGHTTICKN